MSSALHRWFLCLTRFDTTMLFNNNNNFKIEEKNIQWKESSFDDITVLVDIILCFRFGLWMKSTQINNFLVSAILILGQDVKTGSWYLKCLKKFMSSIMIIFAVVLYLFHSTAYIIISFLRIFSRAKEILLKAQAQLAHFKCRLDQRRTK